MKPAYMNAFPTLDVILSWFIKTFYSNMQRVWSHLWGNTQIVYGLAYISNYSRHKIRANPCTSVAKALLIIVLQDLSTEQPRPHDPHTKLAPLQHPGASLTH